MSPAADGQPAILLVDDEPEILEGARATLRNAGLQPVETLADSRRVMPWLESQPVRIIVLDLFMPHVSGLQLLAEIQQKYPEISIIVMTASQEVDVAVTCMKEGAFDYLVKPVEKNRLISAVKKATDIQSLRRQLGNLKQSLLSGQRQREDDPFVDIITASPRIRPLFQYIDAVADSREPILITGETGVGKELVAQAVHRASQRQGKFVTINAAGLDDTVFTDTLFGHKKGAFTGADKAREGLIAKAVNGTLFLDEIGDLSEASQIKLLRLMQEHNYYPLGSDVPRKSSARIVLATNRDLRKRVSEGRFRADLYYRLAVHEIVVPPLRKRKEDIPLLTAHFLEEAAEAMGKTTPTPPKELFALLATHDFPGNVRELRAMVFDAVAQHRARILSMKHFKRVITHLQPRGEPEGDAPAAESTVAVQFTGPCPTLKEAERLVVREAMKRAKGNQGIAASMLGISRQALNRRLAHMFSDSGVS